MYQKQVKIATSADLLSIKVIGPNPFELDGSMYAYVVFDGVTLQTPFAFADHPKIIQLIQPKEGEPVLLNTSSPSYTVNGYLTLQGHTETAGDWGYVELKPFPTSSIGTKR